MYCCEKYAKNRLKQSNFEVKPIPKNNPAQFNANRLILQRFGTNYNR